MNYRYKKAAPGLPDAAFKLSDVTVDVSNARQVLIPLLRCHSLHTVVGDEFAQPEQLRRSKWRTGVNQTIPTLPPANDKPPMPLNAKC
jgi:hypothetical protein